MAPMLAPQKCQCYHVVFRLPTELVRIWLRMAYLWHESTSIEHFVGVNQAALEWPTRPPLDAKLTEHAVWSFHPMMPWCVGSICTTTTTAGSAREPSMEDAWVDCAFDLSFQSTNLT
jgi:hypothetical protein